MAEGKSEGKTRINILAENTVYFREKLKSLGFVVKGHPHSPVVPLMVCIIGRLCEFIREAKAKGIGVIGVGYPAVKLTESRVRFCLSASHTREMLDEVIRIVNDIGDRFKLKYA
ncbi:serine palmitoyltransferase 3-like protein [Dinothrombium tinctorium]|uniref:Serine palmitoyltransferase 3-like protein n=1 Tax=Dinothrombium tinctorium TaxID=1965070 RepID=A0A3S4RHV9_9ACAR|nr:serine palmitoyltransferase 3-like protein [Dinothrombium tinctorium]